MLAVRCTIRYNAGQHRINLTGGKPYLREDLMEIVAVLIKKAPRLKISTNGYFTCGAANDLFFLDPTGLVLVCNGSGSKIW